MEASRATSFTNCGNFGLHVMWEVEVEIEPPGEIFLLQSQLLVPKNFSLEHRGSPGILCLFGCYKPKNSGGLTRGRAERQVPAHAWFVPTRGDAGARERESPKVKKEQFHLVPARFHAAPCTTVWPNGLRHWPPAPGRKGTGSNSLREGSREPPLGVEPRTFSLQD